MEPGNAADMAKKIRGEVAAKVAEGLELSLWASDSLLTDPIAISMDDKGGIYYTQGTRLENSEFDIRGHRDWMTPSISFQSVEDRRKFLRTTLAPEKSEENKQIIDDLNEDGSHDWRDLLVEKESVWHVTDESGDGYADKAKMFIEDFNEEISDLANGVLIHEDEVFIAVGPDLWKTKDLDGDGIADEKESISHGWAVHIGFGAHGMSGVTVGPDGRIWWGIGDIGMNVVDKEGNRWKYPNQGVIVRCEPDGSNFEVFAAGLRNTHEFVFDEYGNLITEDNDGDHPGERERLVYITNGSDGGWRTNWQFGKYTDPKNNKYKVWMDEKLHIPRWEGQAAYITPPIINYVNGPTGMAYNPGTALGEEWKNFFFIAEFRGSPANSPVHAFKLRPSGASFELDTTLEVVSGLLPTGLRFGPDGALYFADWIDGWGVKEQGRIWKLDVPGGAGSNVRKETQELLASDFSQKNTADLGQFLKHPDMRVRQKSQFELAKREEQGLNTFKSVVADRSHQLARIHALWGLGQLARKEISVAKNIVPYLSDEDPEIQAQAAKMIGDVRYGEAGSELIELVKQPSLRVQFFAAEALGRTANKEGFQPILDMLIANADKDAWLRHAGALALARIGESEPLIALKDHPSRSARIAAVVALRRMRHAGIAQFLNDKEEYIVTEAARGINDDYSIEDALPDLADLLTTTSFSGEPLIRRSINANLRVGEPKNLDNVVQYALSSAAPDILRAEAVSTISTWAKPSPLDRVDGRPRRFIMRNAKPVLAAFEPVLGKLLNDPKEQVQIEAAKGAGYLKIKSATTNLLNLVKRGKTPSVRAEALKALNELEAEQLVNALEVGLKDKSGEVRSVALGIIPGSSLPADQSIQLFEQILKNGDTPEKQAVFSALSNLNTPEVSGLLDQYLSQLVAGNLEPEVQLDVIEAVENTENSELNKKLADYQNAKSSDDPLALYREALFGGNPRKGGNLFYRHEGAQCVRCHTIWEYGGDAGPVLSGVASRLSREELLLSMVEPSAQFSAGYAVVTLELKDGETVAGIVQEESDTQIIVKAGKDRTQTIDKDNIAKRENVPSAMLPMKEVLTKGELRDLVAFLGSLEEGVHSPF